MSGSLPNTNFQAINLRSNQKTLFSETDSGKTFRRQVQGQRFSFTVSYPLLTRADFAPIMAFMVKQRSRKENFTITLPTSLDSQGNETGTLLVNGSHTAGDTTIAIDAFAGDGAGRLKAGDFIKFAHDKVYMIVDDVTSSSNAATVTIEPPLRTALADNSAVTYKSIPVTVHMTNDVQEFQTNSNDKDGNLLFKYEIDVIESL
ncbi:Coat-protein like (icosahedral) [uncultured Mediterranean phage uvMED]|nr:Coat-protein like (icosahedral) [uncultured Mediterranean phage uvMED]BAQ90951.1 Coat-protein like (icosahedral) [uncultured Mediterranean phage uvMED]